MIFKPFFLSCVSANNSRLRFSCYEIDKYLILKRIRNKVHLDTVHVYELLAISVLYSNILFLSWNWKVKVKSEWSWLHFVRFNFFEIKCIKIISDNWSQNKLGMNLLKKLKISLNPYSQILTTFTSFFLLHLLFLSSIL